MIRIAGMLLVTGTLAALGLRAGEAVPADAARAPVRVSVAVTDCQEDAVTITVSPWQAQVAPGDDLAWTQTGADSVAIEPTTPGWPFPAPNPRAARGALASAGALAAGRAPAGRVFNYGITLFCGDRVLRIDPEIIIGEGP